MTAREPARFHLFTMRPGDRFQIVPGDPAVFTVVEAESLGEDGKPTTLLMARGLSGDVFKMIEIAAMNHAVTGDYSFFVYPVEDTLYNGPL